MCVRERACRRSTPVVGQSASKLRGSVRGMLFPGQQQVLHGDTKFVVHAKSDGQVRAAKEPLRISTD
eukprot:2237081-Pleurochrysis_carterae.AAC.1